MAFRCREVVILHKEEKSELIKRVTSASLKAISGKPELDVSFSPGQSNINSDIIVNITNDSWFGDFSGPYQHFYFAKLRAAEFNKTLIRVSVNGISAGIDNFGRVIKFSKLNQQKNTIISIPINSSNNEYIRLHKIIFFLIFFPLLVILFFNKKNA